MRDKPPNPTPFEFAEKWYTPEQAGRAIKARKDDNRLHFRTPEDIYSHEFAVWLTTELRFAMAKGIQVGRGQAKQETSDDGG